MSNYKVLCLLALGVFSLDQISKAAVAFSIPFGTYWEPIPVLGSWVYWVHVGNTGVGWSLFQGASLFFGFFGLAFLLSIYLLRVQLDLQKTTSQCVFGLICGGVLGNITDRFARGHVVDFIDVHLPAYRYPSFNIADIAICCGVFLYCIYLFCPQKKQEKS